MPIRNDIIFIMYENLNHINSESGLEISKLTALLDSVKEELELSAKLLKTDKAVDAKLDNKILEEDNRILKELSAKLKDLNEKLSH